MSESLNHWENGQLQTIPPELEKWKKILKAANNDEELKELLEKAEMYWQLKYGNVENSMDENAPASVPVGSVRYAEVRYTDWGSVIRTEVFNGNDWLIAGTVDKNEI